MEASLGKSPYNYEEIRDDTCVYEQKPTKIDDFNEDEEKEVTKRVKKRKQKGRKVAESDKLLKRRTKLRIIRKKEKEMIK